MIFKAFIALAATMSRLSLDKNDIEIVIRCRTPVIERDVMQLIIDEVERNTTLIDDTDVERLKRPKNSGTVHGVPFRIEAMH